MLARKPLVQRMAAKTSSVPAPIGGWNARDVISNMDPLDAVQMTNMFPTPTTVTMRGGYINWATGMSGQIQTLMVYNGASTTKMFGIDATGKKIYDVTSQGAASPTTVSGLSNAIWEYTNISTSGGNFLMCVNGTDKPELYDGTNWTALDGGSTPAITGVTTTTLSSIELFKNRLWFIQKNTLKAWYLPTSSVGGAAQSLDLSSIARKGGYLVDIGTWTMDAGYGVDDMLVFITSQGEVIVYRGTDPSSAATWSEVGLWQLGSPIGQRCLYKYGGDLLVLTYDGLVPLSAALQSDRLDPKIALSDKIQGAVTDATTNYASAAVGWEMFYLAKWNALILNVPIGDGQQQQYVMNTITKSWCNFTGWYANCWALMTDNAFFGANGVVCKAWDTGFSDNGTNIQTTTLQAFNYFEERGVIKYFTRARPILYTNGTPSVLLGLNVDFQTGISSAPLSFSPTSFGLWGSGLWGVSLWGSSLSVTRNWQGVTGLGYCASIALTTASMGLQVEWASTDVVFQQGWAGI